MTASEQLVFGEWLHARCMRARTRWQDAKQARDMRIDLSLDMPRPDGTLMRLRAIASSEVTVYVSALKDHVDFVMYGTWREELEAEWRTSTPRKPVQSENGERDERRKA